MGLPGQLSVQNNTEQDKAPPKKRRAGKQATRYQPTGNRNNGWNSKLAKRAKEKAETPASHAAD